MNVWSRNDAIAMELRHISKGEEMIARQKAVVARLAEAGHDKMLPSSRELLSTFNQVLEFARARLRYLESKSGGPFVGPV